jgi:spore coat protein H
MLNGKSFCKVSYWVAVVFCLSLLTAPAAAQTENDLFDDSVLHEIRIDIRPADWQQLKDHFLDNTYYAADMHWRFNGKFVDVQQVGIRSRGAGSRSPIKPGLRVDFDRFNVGQQFLGLKSFILRNNSQDASMLHERISFQLMRRLGIAAPRAAHTYLYVNGEYIGLYMIVENIDKTFLQSHFGSDDGYLYKYEHGSIENSYAFTYPGPDLSLYCPLPFKPETHESDPKCGPLEAMIRTMNQVSEAQFENSMTEYLDLRAFMREIAAEAYLAESDGMLGDFGLNNFYLFRSSNSNHSEILPWDKNRTFRSVDRSIWLNTDVNVLARRSLTIPALWDTFVETISNAAMLAGGPGGWFEQEIAKEYNQVRDAARADVNKECDDEVNGGLKACTNEEFESAIVFMIQFARDRNVQVGAQLAETLGAVPTFGLKSFAVPDRGGASFVTAGGSGSPAAGYARIQPDDGSTAPAGLAIFGFRQDNVLVTEAAVPASSPISNGRIYADVNGPVSSGLAIANPNSEPATITFYFTDSLGRNYGEGSTIITAGGQMARFLNESPFDGGASISGSFTFASSLPVAVVALRGFTNERSSFLITTLPVIDLGDSAVPPSILPHFADGGGWMTEIVLVNPSDNTLTGTVQFWGQGTAAVAASIGNSSPYFIPPRSSFRLTTSGTGPLVRSGSVRLIATGGLPVALAVFSFKTDGVTITQTGVLAIGSASAFRMYVETSGDSIQSGIAIANPSPTSAPVTLELTTLSGNSTGLSGTVTVPANGQTSMFLNQIPGMQQVPREFQGILRVSASGPISVLALRGHYNERGDLLITTTSPVAETAAPAAGERFFAHLVDSGGYTTQFILYSAYPEQSVSGAVRYFGQGGEPLNLRLQ